ncbi:MAG: hypothetical protein RIR18_401 [Pseudomonadota bacterium]|jgi:hypothetical protein
MTPHPSLNSQTLGRFSRRLILAVALLAQLLAPPLAFAGEVTLRNPLMNSGEDGYVLSVEVAIELGSKLEEALTRGVPLYFVQEFDMSRPRWYWIEDKRFAKTQTVRLYYHALTRQYRVGNGGVHQAFSTLDEALRYLVHARNWSIIDKADTGNLKPGESYQAVFRVRLDSAQLPRPLQISVLFVKDWELGGEVRWTFVVPAEVK